MTSIFNFILWNVSPEWFSIGPLSIRWYGLFFALGFVVGQQILIRIYKQEGKSEKHVETLTLYMIIATVIGARLGHVLFYDFQEYMQHPLEIIKIWKGGLASHGAAIGILIAIYLYSRKTTGQSYFYVLDRLVITIAFAGCLIRLGNLMNSEIVGRPSDAPYSFLFVHETAAALKETGGNDIKEVGITKNNSIVPYTPPFAPGSEPMNIQGIDIKIDFKRNKVTKEALPDAVQELKDSTYYRYEGVRQNVIYTNHAPQIVENNDGSYSAILKAYAIPRLPSQLFEAISSFLLFLLLYFIYNRKKGATPEGRIFGLFVVILFSLRFIYEFQKENQAAFESSMIETLGINMGQLLSIPFVVVGIFILMRSFRKKNEIS